MSVIRTKKIDVGRMDKYPIHFEMFNSALEVAETCKTRRITDSSFHNMATKDIGSWEGVKTYGEALDLLRNGYQPTVEAMRGVFKADRMGESKRIAFQNNVHGFAPIVPLALKGVPNNMLNMTMKPMKAKVLDVYYDMTTSWETGSNEIIEAGQKILGSIVELERQGYRFNLYGIQSYSNSAGADMLIVKLKDACQPLDLKRISFPLTHTGFFRVIGFDWYSKVPDGQYRGGYGHALAFEFKGKEIDRLTEQMFGKNAVLLQCTNVIKQDKDHVKEVLTNANCKDR